MVLRLGSSLIIAACITLILFYIMQALISSDQSVLTEDQTRNLVDFVRVQEEQEVRTKDRQPKKPPPPDEPPPDTPQQKFNVGVNESGYSMSDVDMGVQADIGGGGFGVSDGEYLPIVKVQPIYPRRALSRGMSGWVIVEFTVTERGTVADPRVVENCGWVKNARTEEDCHDSPNSIFDRAALKAAEKFKYKPKVIDGEPVATAGVRNKITFELTDD